MITYGWRLIFLFISIPVLLTACSKKMQLSGMEDVERLKSEGEMVVYLERTPCYGSCPTYKLEIYSNGLVIFEGIRFVEHTGKQYGEISIERIDQIMKKADEVGYFEMADQYPVDEVPPQDIPKTITIINKGEKTNKIVNHNFQSPESLKEFEDFIDKSVKDVKWHIFDSKIAE